MAQKGFQIFMQCMCGFYFLKIKMFVWILMVGLTIVNGLSIWTGGTTDSETRIMIRNAVGANVSILKYDGKLVVQEHYVKYPFERIYVSGLDSLTIYEYVVKSGGGDVLEMGKFSTFPKENERKEFKFGFGSCAFTASESLVFEHMMGRNFDFFVHLGDLLT
jgi:phosphodiesterase/alkaline phosphatase D-like protein